MTYSPSKSPRRYYWHKKLKKLGIEYDAKTHSIFVPHGTEKKHLPKAVLVLMEEHGYSVTSRIIDPVLNIPVLQKVNKQ